MELLGIRIFALACSPDWPDPLPTPCFPNLTPFRLCCCVPIYCVEQWLCFSNALFMSLAWKSLWLKVTISMTIFFFPPACHLKYDQALWVSYKKFFSVNIWNQSKTWLFHLISHVLFDVACFSNPVSLPSEAAPQRTQRFQYWSWRSTEGHLTNATLSPSRSSWKFFNVFLFFCERT